MGAAKRTSRSLAELIFDKLTKLDERISALQVQFLHPVAPGTWLPDDLHVPQPHCWNIEAPVFTPVSDPCLYEDELLQVTPLMDEPNPLRDRTVDESVGIGTASSSPLNAVLGIDDFEPQRNSTADETLGIGIASSCSPNAVLGIDEIGPQRDRTVDETVGIGTASSCSPNAVLGIDDFEPRRYSPADETLGIGTASSCSPNAALVKKKRRAKRKGKSTAGPIAAADGDFIYVDPDTFEDYMCEAQLGEEEAEKESQILVEQARSCLDRAISSALPGLRACRRLGLDDTDLSLWVGRAFELKKMHDFDACAAVAVINQLQDFSNKVEQAVDSAEAAVLSGG